MQATITYDLNGSQQHQQYDDLTSEQIAHHLINGGRIWPQYQADRKSEFKFLAADFAVVAIDTHRLNVDKILSADFTQRYASALVHQVGDHDYGRCILIFQLPSIVTMARDYVLIVEGLKTLYAGGVKHHSALHQWGAAALDQFVVLGGKLDDATISNLKILGYESKKLATTKSAGFYRSRFTLSMDTPLCVDGLDQTVTLERVGASGVKVFCPVHVDASPTARTYLLEDGTPAVVCGCCERTYTLASAGKKYNFGYFDRVIGELAEIDKTKPREQRLVTQTASRYLPKLGLWDGVLCVKSPKGSGKTEQLENIVREAKERKLSVLLLGHRRSLLQSMSRRLGLTCYFTSEADLTGQATPSLDMGKVPVDFGDGAVMAVPSKSAKGYGEPGVVKVAPAEHYAICLDSMPDLDPERRPYDVVIIDEAEQVFAHLVGDTVKAKRREIYQRLRHYLRMAKSVVLMDADLGMVTMKGLFGVHWKRETDVRFWINAPEAKAGTVKLYAAKAQLMDRIQHAVEAGEKCYIATNSKAKTEEIAKTLALHNKGLRVEYIHSGNSSSSKVQGLLRNIVSEFEHNLDVLVASPALGTGVDITFKSEDGSHRTVVQHVFGLFEGRITTHIDCDQHLMRVRHPGEVHVWIDPAEQNFETDSQILRDQLGNLVRNEHSLLDYADDGKPIFATDDGLVGIWAEQLAASNGSINQLATLFKKLRADTGWTFESVEIDHEGVKAGADALKRGREERLRDRAMGIVSAAPFSSGPDGTHELKRLESRQKKGLPMMDTERARLDRHRLESFYGVPVDADLVTFDAEGRMRGAISNLELLLSPRGREALSSHYQHQSGRVAFDLEKQLSKRQLLQKLFRAAGVMKRDAFDSSAVFEHGTLDRFIAELEKQSGAVELAFGLAMRRDARRNRVRQLSEVLRLVGLTTKLVATDGIGGTKIRRYALDEDRLALVTGIAKERLSPWYKYEQAQVQNELHNQSDQWAHEQEEMVA